MSAQIRLEALKLAVCRSPDEAVVLHIASSYEVYLKGESSPPVADAPKTVGDQPLEGNRRQRRAKGFK